MASEDILGAWKARLKGWANWGMAIDWRHLEIGNIVLIVDVSTGLTINDVPKKNKKGKRVA